MVILRSNRNKMNMFEYVWHIQTSLWIPCGQSEPPLLFQIWFFSLRHLRFCTAILAFLRFSEYGALRRLPPARGTRAQWLCFRRFPRVPLLLFGQAMSGRQPPAPKAPKPWPSWASPCAVLLRAVGFIMLHLDICISNHMYIKYIDVCIYVCMYIFLFVFLFVFVLCSMAGM